MARVVLLALAILAVLAPSAAAYELGGAPWPQRTVSYHVTARGYAQAVDRAARAWNRAGARVRLRRAPARVADVRVGYGGSRCSGAAIVGFVPFGESEIRLGRRCPTGLVTLTAVHELGHVLGLDHETRRCARMNPGSDGGGSPSRCRPRALGAWLARPLLPDDRRGARALYGISG